MPDRQPLAELISVYWRQAQTECRQKERAVLELKELARQALHVLDLQQQYFHSRNQSHLQISRDAERRLRVACEAIVRPLHPSLFDRQQQDRGESHDSVDPGGVPRKAPP